MAVEGFTSYSVDNDKKFANYLNKVGRRLSDLSLPLSLIRGDFYKSQGAIFMLSGPGQYPDLAESTKRDKIRKGYNIYPILKRTGRLGESTTNPSHPDAFNTIVDKKNLIIGSLVPYGVYHQSDRPRNQVPLRKFFFIGPEAKRFATSEQMGRLERWLGILKGYLEKSLKKGG